MGTRAAFWLGNPIDLDNREWLGCIAWDGHPDNFEKLRDIATAESFRITVDHILAHRDDAALPNGGWPFPWFDDIFLTDVTYAFFDNRTQVAGCHRAFRPLSDRLDWTEEQADAYYDEPEPPEHQTVPAGRNYDRSQPDSIMIISAKTNV